MATINPVSTVAGQDLQGIVREAKKATSSGVGSALMKFATIKNQQDLKNKASEDYLKGQQQVALGKSVKEIRENEPAYTKYFGTSATVKGAIALDTERALDKAYATAVENIPNQAALSPEEYAKVQQQEFMSYVDGIEDDTVRAQLTVAYSKNSGKLVSMHAKAHAKYVDQRMRSSYEGALMSKASNVQLTYDKDGEAYQDATAQLLTAMKKPQGMDNETYKEIVTETAIKSLQGGNAAMYNQLIDSPLFDELDSKQRSQLYRGYDSYQSEQRSEYAIEIGKSLSTISQYSKSADATMDGLLGQLEEHKSKYGLTPAKAESIINQFATERTKVKDSKDTLTLARQGRFEGMKPAEIKESLNMLRTEFGDSYPEYWASIGVQDKTLGAKWTNSFNVLTLPDGNIDPAFRENLTEFMGYAQLNEDKAYDHISNKETKARVKDILNRYATSGDMDAAIRGRELVEKSKQDTSLSTEKRKEVEKEVQILVEGNWLWQAEIDAYNSEAIKSDLSRRASFYVANGRIDAEDAAELALKDFKAENEKVKGSYIPNAGAPLSKEWSLQDGETPDTVLDSFVDEHRTELFGGYDGDYSVSRSTNGKVLTLTPVDDNGLPVAGGYSITVDSIKQQRIVEKTQEQDAALQAAATSQQASVDQRVQNFQMYYMRSYGKYLSKEDALKRMNEQGRRSKEAMQYTLDNAFDFIPRLRDIGVTVSKLIDSVTRQPTKQQKLVGEANAKLSKQGLAPKSSANMGWGIETAKAGGTSENLGKALDVFAGIESSYGKNLANPTSSARGVFQYLTKANPKGNNAMQTAVTRAMRVVGDDAPAWLTDLQEVAMNGSDEERAKAMTTLSADKAAALLIYDFRGRPQTSELLDRINSGDKEAVWELYSKYHHTNPDDKTKQLFNNVMNRHWR